MKCTFVFGLEGGKVLSVNDRDIFSYQVRYFEAEGQIITEIGTQRHSESFFVEDWNLLLSWVKEFDTQSLHLLVYLLRGSLGGFEENFLAGVKSGKIQELPTSPT